MAEKILKSIKFPGLEDTYVVPEADITLTVKGVPAEAKATGEAIAQKSQVQIVTWEADD